MAGEQTRGDGVVREEETVSPTGRLMRNSSTYPAIVSSARSVDFLHGQRGWGSPGIGELVQGLEFQFQVDRPVRLRPPDGDLSHLPLPCDPDASRQVLPGTHG